jgi:hypothetical protein
LRPYRPEEYRAGKCNLPACQHTPVGEEAAPAGQGSRRVPPKETALMKTAWVFAATVVLGACLNGSLALGQQEQAGSPAEREDSPQVWGHVERPDDAPLPAPQRPPAPRGARSIYVRGPFTSVQANVDAGGANIPGDAANEPSIAVDPNDPDKMAIGWRQFNTVSSNFRQAGPTPRTAERPGRFPAYWMPASFGLTRCWAMTPRATSISTA